MLLHQILHPSKIVTKKDGSKVVKNINGASYYCVNPLCLLSAQAMQTQGRERLSALAVGVSGLSMLLFVEKFLNLTTKSATMLTSLKLTLPFF